MVKNDKSSVKVVVELPLVSIPAYENRHSINNFQDLSFLKNYMNLLLKQKILISLTRLLKKIVFGRTGGQRTDGWKDRQSWKLKYLDALTLLKSKKFAVFLLITLSVML